MESKLAIYIGIVVMLIIFTTVIVIAFNKQPAGESCGGADNLSCPFGYYCQDSDNPDVVGMCISDVVRLKTWVYTKFPILKPKTSYTCPEEEWINCLPGVGSGKPRCQEDYLDWAKSNCPGFRGAAY